LSFCLRPTPPLDTVTCRLATRWRYYQNSKTALYLYGVTNTWIEDRHIISSFLAKCRKEKKLKLYTGTRIVEDVSVAL
jgi:hypothetical protein